MADLELTRTAGDRRVYALEGVGTLRLHGFASRTATAASGAACWRIARRGFWRRLIEATDEAGAVVGTFEPRGLRRGGSLRWTGRDFELRPASTWRDRYALADGGREVAVLEGKSWGRRPVKVAVDDSVKVEPGLLLFVCFGHRRLLVLATTQDADPQAALCRALLPVARRCMRARNRVLCPAAGWRLRRARLIGCES